MTLYSTHKDKIDDFDLIVADNVIMYTNRVSEEELNKYGYFYVQYLNAHDRRFYLSEENKGIVDGKYLVWYTKIERPLAEVKDQLKAKVKEIFISESKRPRVDTGLGYSIDGSREDLENFNIGKKRGFPFIKDVDGMDHPATTAEYDAAITAIEDYGMFLLQKKWNSEADIENLKTIDECIAFDLSLGTI